MRQLSRKASVYALAATTVLAGSGMASAAGLGIPDPIRSPTTSAQSASGDVTTQAGTHIVYSAKRAKGAQETKATGHFVGSVTVAGNRVIQFGGPITCLYVKGSSVGFFYPITESDPAAVKSLGAGVFIYVDSDGKGKATAMNFLPVPAATTDGCYPLPGLAPAAGKAVVSGG